IILFMVSLLSTGMLHPIPKQQRSAIPEGIPRDRVEEAPAGQQFNPRTLSYISWSDGCVYTVVVRGLTCRANRCARNRSRDARYTFVIALWRIAGKPDRRSKHHRC